MIVPSATVKAADHIRSHVMVMNCTDVSVLLFMIVLEKRYRCMIDWGGRTMLRDLAGRRV
jgi:hypothetical protein